MLILLNMHYSNKNNSLRLNLDSSGIGLIEYMVVIALIIFATLAAIYFFGTSSSDKFETIGSAINGSKTAGDDTEELQTEELTECGDNLCNPETESCEICPTDCECDLPVCNNDMPCMPCTRLQPDCSCAKDDSVGGCLQLGEVCVNGTCRSSDPCLGVICGPCHNCEDGDCLVADWVGGCAIDQGCSDGLCISTIPTCDGVICPPCQSCSVGRCTVTDQLNNCGPCNRCDGGACISDNIVGGCETGEYCLDGNCVSS